MVKTRIVQSLMIIGSLGFMLGMSAFADNAPEAMRASQYMAPNQASSQSLGTIRQGDVGNVSSSPAMDSMTSGSQASATTDSDSTLQPMHQGDVSYITGGIGDEERNAMKEEEKNYNLRILSASKSGDFLGDTHIVISRKGEAILDAQSGPLFYVSLPAGSYVIEATSDGQTKKQTVMIGKTKASYVHLSW